MRVSEIHECSRYPTWHSYRLFQQVHVANHTPPIKFLMIFISFMGGVWFATCTCWNNLYECQVGPLAWDLGKISRALMNFRHAHSLVVQHSNNNKDCEGVLWWVDHYHTPSAFGSYSLLYQLYCVKSYIACYTMPNALHLMLTWEFSFIY